MSWHKGASKLEGKDFANASDYLETWDDSDSITVVNAQKRFETFTKWWHNHSEAQYQGFELIRDIPK